MKSKKIKYPSLKRWDAVIVKWVDSGSQDGWSSEDDLNFNRQDCETLGFFYKEIPNESVTLVLSRDMDNNDVCGVMSIPLVAITYLKRIEY